MHTMKGNIMSAKVKKPLPKVGVASNGGQMHYSAGAIIEDEFGRIFMLDRKYEPLGFAGMAGHIDVGETSYQALVREASEEIGAELKRIRRLGEEEVTWNHCRNDGVHRIDVHYWYLFDAFVKSVDIHVDPHEAKRWEWFTREEIRTRRYVREGKEHILTLEPVWEYWFKKVGIIQ